MGWDLHGGPTSQPDGLKESAANNFVPDIIAHLQMSCGAHASKGYDCFGSTVGAYRSQYYFLMRFAILELTKLQIVAHFKESLSKLVVLFTPAA